MSARVLDIDLQLVARSNSVYDIGNFYKLHTSIKERHKNHKLEKEEVGFVQYKPGKAPDRFFGNPRNVQERAHPELDEERLERVARLPLNSYPDHHQNKLKERGPLLGSGPLDRSWIAPIR